MPPELFRWVDAAGEVYPLDGSLGVWLRNGRTGRFMPPVELELEAAPEGDGSWLRSVRYEHRELDLPIVIEGSTPTQLRQRLRAIWRWMDPRRGDGKLQCVAPDGIERELVCRYREGLEGTEGALQLGNVLETAVTLVAPDPFWTESTTYVSEYHLGGAPVGFLDSPFFPLKLTETTIFGDHILFTNAGDVEAWPRWIVTGPMTELILTNTTSGQSLTLTYTLPAGEQIVIDTRPRKKTVLYGTTSLYGAPLDPLSALWPLLPGTNTIGIELSGATTDTRVTLTYQLRYFGP